jgi:hypothetical protein
MKFVFRVRIKPGQTAEEYAAAWVKASEIIQRSPGALGTRLHRRIGKSDELLAIASWDSKASRDASPANSEVDVIINEAAKYAQIEIVGEFDEPEWVVLPRTAELEITN